MCPCGAWIRNALRAWVPDYVLNGEFGRFSLAPTDLQPDFWVIRKTNGGNVGTASPYLASGKARAWN
jgi:hypothetical protein